MTIIFDQLMLEDYSAPPLSEREEAQRDLEYYHSFDPYNSCYGWANHMANCMWRTASPPTRWVVEDILDIAYGEGHVFPE